jgi:hypothetical protein
VYEPLPRPERGGQLEELRQFLNLDQERPDEWILVIGFLLAALRPHSQYFVLVVHGEQGTGKSSLVRLLRTLIDPNVCPLRAEPHSKRDLVIAANNSHVQVYDNLPHLEPRLSDAFCRMATGGGFSTRERYSNAEAMLLAVQRPLILNGIEELATRSDLLDRALVLYLPMIPPERRCSEQTLQATFQAAHPRLLGALLTAVAGALQHMDTIHFAELPRMADATLWVTAAEAALGWPSETFVEAYRANRDAAQDLVLEASAIATTLVHFMETRPTWEGTATQLLTCLKDLADTETVRQHT